MGNVFLEADTGQTLRKGLGVDKFVDKALKGWTDIALTLDNKPYPIKAYIDADDDNRFYLGFTAESELGKRINFDRQNPNVTMPATLLAFDSNLKDSNSTNEIELPEGQWALKISEPNVALCTTAIKGFIKDFIEKTAAAGRLPGDFAPQGVLGTRLIRNGNLFNEDKALEFPEGPTVYDTAMAASAETAAKANRNKAAFIEQLTALKDSSGAVESLLVNGPAYNDPKVQALYDNFMVFVDNFGAKDDIESYHAEDATTALAEPAADDVLKIARGFADEFSTQLDRYGQGEFKNGSSLNTEIDGYTLKLKENTTPISYDSTPISSRLGSDKVTNATRATYNGAVGVKGIKERLQDGLATARKDKKFDTFLTLGENNNLKDESNIRLYENLVGFAKVLGLDDALGAPDASQESSDKEPAGDAKEKSAEAAGKDDEKETGNTSDSGGDSKEKSADAKTAAEPAPEPDPGQTIGFYVTIFGADKGTSAQIELEFDQGIGDNPVTKYSIDPIEGTKFDKRLAIRVRKPELAEFWKVNSDTEATVRITAVPASGGDAITVERQIPIKWPLRQNVNLLPAEVFRFAETTGRRTYTGAPADEGRGGAKDDRDKQADVAQLYYTKSGGIRTSTIPASVDAVGRTYRFTFDTQPMLVPIEITVPAGTKLEESKKLTEATVPHWIFLSNRGSGGRGDGSGDGKTGAGGGGGKKAVNIAVSQFGIKTKSKWIAVPNVGAVWDKDTFKVRIAPSAAGGPDDSSGLAPRLGVAEINKMNLDMREIEDAVLEALFGSSAAWSKLGISNNCWARDPSVTGTGGVTAREITYKVGGSA